MNTTLSNLTTEYAAYQKNQATVAVDTLHFFASFSDLIFVLTCFLILFLLIVFRASIRNFPEMHRIYRTIIGVRPAHNA
ncbi:eORF6 [Murid betaherpesvirus 8]|uniref:EORF6 n=1 Tax=Rat cytomegalovirus (isolate England) TaxID=1261657 RepID=K7YA71_RCMVE|nr:eORF6 [Murid betaherpesvirus 8]AFX83429.1 eORF6 [Murid betaherpesvirus 8]WEG71901.1 protein m119.4 [Murid betaherpesvirus 8]WPH25291.1 protein m119.4 [Murid betaherpesvirus 8]WPH25424.1 protein m119.4 [Murid betaherpesvirus 8]